MRKIEEDIAGPAGVGKSGSAPVTRTPDFRHQDQHAIVNSRMYGALQIDWR
jgi:hypothetical protein